MTAPADRQPGWRTANRPLPPRSGERPAGASVAARPAPISAPAPVAAPAQAVALVAPPVALDVARLAEAAGASGGPLPPRPLSQAAAPPPESLPQPVAIPPRKAPDSAPRSKPDAKPMRIVYGAGALAAMSAMTVGLVQPDFSSLTDDAAPAAGDQGTSSRDAAAETGNGRRAREAGGRRVVRYVFLRPGDDAPNGARVITAAEAARRGVTAGISVQEPTRSRGTNGSASRPDRGSARRSNQPQPDEPRNNQPAAPRPEPDPPVRTHQSGG